MKRLIRFKEWGQYVDILQVPDEDYIGQSDGSLEKKEYRVRTDADGNISTGNDLDDEGEIILMLGDSFVESLYVDEQKRFPSVVERQLVNNGLNLRVWNGGYSGATSLHLYINLVAKYLKFSSKIRAVLYFQPSCDSGPLHHSNSYWNQNKFFAPIIESRNNKLNSALFDSSVNFEGLYRIHRVLHGTCIEYGIPIVTVKTPSKNINWGVDPLQDRIFRNKKYWEYRKNFLQSIADVAEEVANEFKSAVFDLKAEMNEYPLYFYDEVHLNEAGSEKVGKIIFDYLMRNIIK